MLRLKFRCFLACGGVAGGSEHEDVGWDRMARPSSADRGTAAVFNAKTSFGKGQYLLNPVLLDLINSEVGFVSDLISPVKFRKIFEILFEDLNILGFNSIIRGNI